ncbi:flagellar hook-length control protein FliK [Marinospirillum sp.]|uniref:flagellar hook-length control protein FliK n=1 Tax=Marinospirillum sp. TaxID=2183934 RepID=UPI00384E61E5
MNSSASLKVFLDAPPASSLETKKPQPSARSENKQAFQQHLKGNLEQPSDRKKSGWKPPEKSETPEQKLAVRRAQPEKTDTAKVAKDGKELPVSGEKLPLSKEAQEFVASLPADERSDFLDDLQAWLQGLSDEDLSELKSLLQDGDLASLQEMLPEELQDFLAQLAEQLDIQLEDLHQGLQQLLASIQKGDIDFRQLASMRFDSQSGELRVLVESGDRLRTAGQASQRSDTEAAMRGRDTAEAGKETSEGRQEKQDGRQDRQEGRQENRLEALVARLGRGDTSVLSSRSGSESMQQLIQAAGMGLGNTPAAQPAAARMAASMPAMSMMSQAAVQANAEALANRISTMQSRGMQIAEMRLDPPDLGNLRVQIKMQGDQASVIFQSPNAQARDLLENALPRLKEMLEEQGLNLADASVSEESYSQEGDQEQGDGSSGQGLGLAEGGEAEEEETISYFEEPLGLVDYYA